MAALWNQSTSPPLPLSHPMKPRIWGMVGESPDLLVNCGVHREKLYNPFDLVDPPKAILWAGIQWEHKTCPRKSDGWRTDGGKAEAVGAPSWDELGGLIVTTLPPAARWSNIQGGQIVPHSNGILLRALRAGREEPALGITRSGWSSLLPLRRTLPLVALQQWPHSRSWRCLFLYINKQYISCDLSKLVWEVNGKRISSIRLTSLEQKPQNHPKRQFFKKLHFPVRRDICH